MTREISKPLTADEIADLKAKAKAATPGPYFAATDEAEDAPDHRGSGLALVDTGRREDWPIARLIEWTQARYIEATPPETVLRLIATIEQQAEQIEKLRGALTRARRQIDPLALGTFAAVDEALATTEPVNDKR